MWHGSRWRGAVHPVGLVRKGKSGGASDRWIRVWLALLLGTVGAGAQTIGTVAGSPLIPGNTYKSTSVSISAPSAVAVDATGNVYIAAAGPAAVPMASAIFKVTPSGTLSYFAGTDVPGYSGDGGLAVKAQLNLLLAYNLALDSAGDLYIPDAGNCVVRRVAASSGIITTVAGNGTCGYGGDGGAAASAELNLPAAVAVDAQGNLFIADAQNQVIREVVAATGNMETVAGDKGSSSTATSGPALTMPIGAPKGLAVDGGDDVFISSSNGHVYVWNAKLATVSIIAGVAFGKPVCAGSSDPDGDGCPATQASFFSLGGLALDAADDLFIADGLHGAVREINAASGLVSTVAGNGTPGGNPFRNLQCCSPVQAAPSPLGTPSGVALDAKGDLFLADPGAAGVFEVASTILTAVAGNGSPSDTGDGGAATVAQVDASGIVVDGSGNLFIAGGDGSLREVTRASGQIATLPEFLSGSLNPTGDICLQPSAAGGIGVDGQGRIYFSNNTNNVCRLTPTANGLVVDTVAGDGANGGFDGYGGDGGPAVAALMQQPTALTVDSGGDVYFVDSGNNVVREIIAASGSMRTVAGNGTSGYAGDGGPATAAQLGKAMGGIALDAAGNLYIADTTNHRVREVNASSGIIATVAGSGASGAGGRGGSALAAELGDPTGLAVDGAGNLFITDVFNGEVDEVFAATGILQAISGDGAQMSPSFSGSAITAGFFLPRGVAIDSGADLFFTDAYGDIREIVTQPQPSLSGSSLAFGNQAVGVASSAQTLTIANAAGTSLVVGKLAFSGAQAGDFSETDTCGAAVAPGASCAVAVTFTPGAEGNRSGTLTITDNSLSSPHSVALSGTGTAATATLNASTLTFTGEILANTSAAQAVTLANNGNVALAISSLGVSGDFAETNNCGSSLAASATCSVQVTFTPTAAGSRTGTLTIADSASPAQQTVALTGAGEDVVISAGPGSSTSASVTPGQSGQFSLSLAPAGGLSGTVSLSCAVPAGSLLACSVNPATFTAGAGAQTVTVSVTTTAASSFRPAPTPRAPRAPVVPVLMLGLAGAVCWLVTRRRGRVVAMAGIAGAILLAGCGGSSSNAVVNSNPGTAAGNYVVTLTATTAGGTKTAQLTVVVN